MDQQTGEVMKENEQPRAGRRTVALAALAAGALVAAAVPAVATAGSSPTEPTVLVTLCSGVAGPVVIPGDLRVPAGESCILDGTTVQGDADVRAGANLVLEGNASVEGDVLVRSDAYLEIIRGAVHGESQLRQAFGGYFAEATLDAVDARNSGFVYTVDSQQADQLSINTETAFESVWVEGEVDTRGGVLTDLEDTVVTGDLSIRTSQAGTMICGSEVDGAALVAGGEGGVVQLGAGPQADCDLNVFGADVQLNGNSTVAGTHIGGNVVRGDLACSNNDPEPAGADNRVRGQGTGQCAELEPVGGDTGARGDDAGADRRAATEQLIDERSTQAREHARSIGAAELVTG